MSCPHKWKALGSRPVARAGFGNLWVAGQRRRVTVRGCGYCGLIEVHAAHWPRSRAASDPVQKSTRAVPTGTVAYWSRARGFEFGAARGGRSDA